MTVLIVTPLGPTAASYYFRGQEGGRWMGRGTELLGLEGEVGYRDLVRVLQGCHPDHGGFLPARRPARRRAGWDLTLAAPKSLSLLASSTTKGGEQIHDAHGAAVAGVVEHLEQRHLRARGGGTAPTAGLVAACFGHGINGAAEPHVHSHLLLCNLACDRGGRWSPVHDSWWTERAALGALYQLGLRHHLRAAGLGLDWRLHADGLGDLADVPRAAVRTASGRSRAAAVDRAAFDAGGAGGRRFAIRSGATIQTRPAQPSQPWQERVQAAGFGPAAADALMAASSGTNQTHLEPNLEQAVTMWLATRRSSFRHADVLVALAASAPGGLPAGQADRWAEQFCRAAIPVETRPTASPRWTTAMAQAADRRLVEVVERRRTWGRGASEGASGGTWPSPEMARAGGGPPTAPPEDLAARQLLQPGPGSVHILAAPPGWTNLLAQAALLELAATTWRETGLRVAIATSGTQAETRWQTLTGIGRFQPGAAVDVLIVDYADRRSTAELLGLLTALNGTERAILLEGGTRPRVSWLHSDGLAWLGDRLGRLDPGPAPNWGLDHPPTHRVDPPRGLTPVRYPSAAEAARDLLARWASESGRTASALVGMGYPEVDALNRAARAVLARRGELFGPEQACGTRVFQAGDRVLALRRLSVDLPQGCPLEVVAVDRRRSTVTVSNQRKCLDLDLRSASHLGYRYAVTPALAARVTGPLLVLGPPHALGRHLDRVVAAAVMAPAPDPALERMASRHELPGRELEWGGRSR